MENRLLVRFAPFTALRERRVMPREVSIVLVGDDSKRQQQNYGVKVWDMVKNILRKRARVGHSDSEPTPTMFAEPDHV